jgi:hypothetical protein
MGQDNQTVREHAYALWEEDGRPEGRHLDHWARAEVHSRIQGAPEKDAVERALGPSHGNEDFGGHDAEAEVSAESGVGVDLGASLPSVQVPDDSPEEDEKPVHRDA